MVVNITFPEIAETKVTQLPPASLDTLKKMREDACSSSSFGFKLQSQQRFLRRVLSPDSPTQNLLLVHGTGTGKTLAALVAAINFLQLNKHLNDPEDMYKLIIIGYNKNIFLQERSAGEISDCIQRL